jgi:hypothetical protein
VGARVRTRARGFDPESEEPVTRQNRIQAKRDHISWATERALKFVVKVLWENDRVISQDDLDERAAVTDEVIWPSSYFKAISHLKKTGRLRKFRHAGAWWFELLDDVQILE